MRRKLRESRLILPPRAFQAVKSTLDHDDTASEGEEDSDEGKDAVEGTEDEVFKRIRASIDDMVDIGKRALESTPEDFMDGSKGGAKVLHAEEVRMWRASDGEDMRQDLDFHLSFDDSMSSSRPASPSHIAMPDSDASSEGEVEAMTSIFLAAAPPITITDSSF